MASCSRYAEARADMMATVEEAMARDACMGVSVQRWRAMDEDEDERTRWLLACDRPAVVAAVHTYLHRLFKTRAAAVAAMSAGGVGGGGGSMGGGVAAAAAASANGRA